MSSRAIPLATRRPEEGRGEDGVVRHHLGRAGRALGHGTRLGLALARRQVSPAELAPEGGVVLAAAQELDEPVHGVQSLEGVLAVEDAALVDLAEVALHVGPGEGGPAQDDGDVGQAPVVQLLQVLPHDEGGLHEQPAHPDGVGLVLLGGLAASRRCPP